jgi:hypothetical protein
MSRISITTAKGGRWIRFASAHLGYSDCGRRAALGDSDGQARFEQNKTAIINAAKHAAR